MRYVVCLMLVLLSACGGGDPEPEDTCLAFDILDAVARGPIPAGAASAIEAAQNVPRGECK